MQSPEHISIFGDTQHGVPSPRVFHTHPYPTRYHGWVFTVPRFGLPYRENPFQVAGPMPMGALGCAGNPAGPGLKCAPAGVGADDDGGSLLSLTGNVILDAVLGAGIGFLIAPRQEDRLLYAGAGAGAGATLGGIGIAIMAGLGLRKIGQ